MDSGTVDRRPGQPGGRRERNRKMRRDSLRMAAIELFLARGIESVRIDEIAQRGGTAKGNFYRYFNDKADLVREILAPVSSVTLDCLSRCGDRLDQAEGAAALTRAYEAMATEIAEIVLANDQTFLIYLQEHRSPGSEARAPLREFATQLRDGSVHLTERACELGLLRVDDPRVSTLAILGAVERLVLAVLTGEFIFRPDELASTLIGLALDGLRPR